MGSPIHFREQVLLDSLVIIKERWTHVLYIVETLLNPVLPMFVTIETVRGTDMGTRRTTNNLGGSCPPVLSAICPPGRGRVHV